MFFPSLPSLDFTINSFGGLDLTSIPLAFHYVNSSLFWIMEQYTYPMSTTLDLRHTFCETCDAVPVPTIPEVLVETSLTFGKKIRQSMLGAKQKLRFMFDKAKHVVSKWKSKFNHLKSLLKSKRF
jgi:hypothetical protein